MPAVSAGMTVVLSQAGCFAGHDGQAPPDVVCCAATTLAFTTLLRGNGLSAAFSVKVRDA
jgi:hypothetical protein